VRINRKLTTKCWVGFISWLDDWVSSLNEGHEASAWWRRVHRLVRHNYLISWDNVSFSEVPSEYLMSLIRHPLGVFVSVAKNHVMQSSHALIGPNYRVS